MTGSPIRRRDFLRITAAAGLAGPLTSCGEPAGRRDDVPPAVEDRPPNIVLIMADDLGWETIGAYGGQSYSTPRIDGMAERGVRFEHCYAQPLCTPSRVKLMTGRYNVRNYTEFGVLDPGETTFANLFRAAGYATCVVGKWQLEGGLDAPHRFGFDEYCLWQLNRRPGRYPNPGLEINGEQVDFDNGEYGPDVVSDYAADFIDRNADKPFLLYYPMILTHCPFEPTPDSPDWDPASEGSPTYKGDPKYFGDMVEYMDKIVGKLADRLEAAGVRENTLFIFTGDNGTDEPVVSMVDGREVAGGKWKTTDAGTRVPLIVEWSGNTPRGAVCEDLVDMSDFMPTICEAAGIALPEDESYDGRSFLPQLLGKEGNPREWVYVWFSRSGEREEAKIFARTRRYKLYESGEFYDLSEDVLEQHPLADSELGDRARQAKEKLEGVLERYRDVRPDHLK